MYFQKLIFQCISVNSVSIFLPEELWIKTLFTHMRWWCISFIFIICLYKLILTMHNGLSKIKPIELRFSLIKGIMQRLLLPIRIQRIKLRVMIYMDQKHINYTFGSYILVYTLTQIHGSSVFRRELISRNGLALSDCQIPTYLLSQPHSSKGQGENIRWKKIKIKR